MTYTASIDLFPNPSPEVQDFLHPHDNLHDLICDRLGAHPSLAATQPLREAIVADWEAKEATLDAFLSRYHDRSAPQTKSVVEFQHFG